MSALNVSELSQVIVSDFQFAHPQCVKITPALWHVVPCPVNVKGMEDSRSHTRDWLIDGRRLSCLGTLLVTFYMYHYCLEAETVPLI